MTAMQAAPTGTGTMTGPVPLLAGLSRRVCLCCRMADPPPEPTCTLGRDHRVGREAGCPACGRLLIACARRPCSAWREP